MHLRRARVAAKIGGPYHDFNFQRCACGFGSRSLPASALVFLGRSSRIRATSPRVSQAAPAFRAVEAKAKAAGVYAEGTVIVASELLRKRNASGRLRCSPEWPRTGQYFSVARA
jgi:hypothetical protein